MGCAVCRSIATDDVASVLNLLPTAHREVDVRMVSLCFCELTNPLAQLQASGKVFCHKLPPQPQPLLLVFPQLPASHLATRGMLSC